MEEIYANEEYEKSYSRGPSMRQTGPRGSQRRFHKAVIVCLGLLSLLLLAGIIGLYIHYQNSTRDPSVEFSTNKANLNEQLQARDDQLSSLTKQRDLLNVSLAEMTKELQRLQGLLKQKKTCPAGWKMFRCSCYLFSSQKNFWVESRQDCRARGADLAIVDSPEEQEFLTNNKNGDTWIGLTDRDNEGTWKWTDDTLLTQGYWSGNQPDNGGGDPQWGEEDCVYLKDGYKKEGNWNDLRCNFPVQWVCEKTA